MITISGVPIYKKYVINDDYTIGGKDYEREDVKKIEYEKLLNDIINNYAEPIFEFYIKEEKSIIYDEYSFYNFNKPYVKEEMLRDKKILKIIIKMFSKYGIIADTENIVDNERMEYVSINEILYLINQLITLYILKTAIEGIEEIKRFDEEMYYTDLKYKSKLKQVFCYIFNDVKYDPKIYDKETEKEEYYINCRKEIVDYINKRNDLFEQANNKFLYNKKYDVIEYKQQNYKILSILWRNYTESLTASRFEKSKKPSICPICHMPYYKTSNNQKRCSKHSRDEICKQEKQELYDKILETYNNYKLDKKIKKEIEDKILNKKNIREVKKDDLRRLLEKLKSQK